MKQYGCFFTYVVGGFTEFIPIAADSDTQACADAHALLAEHSEYVAVELIGPEGAIRHGARRKAAADLGASAQHP